jgi:hypothetical protein
MPRIKETTVYQFDELPTEAAKNKAREWLREGEQQDFDPEYEYYETAAKLLGITLDERKTGTTRGGKDIYQSDIRWSGFYSPGDGASFVGRYEFAPGCAEAIRKEFPTNTALHQIADDLTVLFARRKLLGKSGIKAKITVDDGREVHKYAMGLEWTVSGDNEDEEISGDEEKALLEAMRDFAGWIYKSLEEEWDYRLSDGQIDESMRANEYEFDEDGDRA